MRFVIPLFALASIAAGAPPTVTAIVNAASYQTGGVSPGSIASVFGTGLGGGTVTAGGVAAPVIFASDGQVNFQVPWELQATLNPGPVSNVPLVVTTGQGSSAIQQLAISGGAPGIFTVNGTNAAMLISATGKTRPAHAGEWVTVYATGLGAVATTPKTGAPLADNIIAPVTASVTATIGGKPAVVGYAGLAPPGPNPYYVGIYEVDVLIPDGVTSTPASDPTLILTVGGAGSNQVAIPVEAGITPALYQWVQLAPSGALSVRAITSGAACPATLVFDGKAAAMTVRAAANLPLYPVTSCEATVPSGTLSATLEGRRLPLAKAAPQRFTVLGDTGCRMQTPTFQNCNLPAEWPAAQIAASAAATAPDLLIHVGDYHYRESACPDGNAGCAFSTWGYNWAVWRDDVFSPLQVTFPVAPWFLVRGNHESCARAGEGWFRFLDVRPYQASCQVNTEPWSTTAGGLQLTHLDVAEADDLILNQTQIDILTRQFSAATSTASVNTWLLFHRPLWAVQPNGTNGNLNMQMATGPNVGGNVTMLLSGHIHFFETLEWKENRAAQVVVGNSGDNLASPSATIAGTAVGGGTVARGTSLGGFGFTTMDLQSDSSWTIVDRDVAGVPKTTCSLAGIKVGCTP
ncbi:MAG: ser/threonine protein phosphatase [Bryobacterales bacterium]|nr:ser/threonine protein phosphatase [Bryobacterales bacterium]